jgi:hypothetical protein
LKFRIIKNSKQQKKRGSNPLKSEGNRNLGKISGNKRIGFLLEGVNLSRKIQEFFFELIFKGFGK